MKESTGVHAIALAESSQHQKAIPNRIYFIFGPALRQDERILLPPV
jgi:hypothetical protein